MAPLIAALGLLAGMIWFATVAFRDMRREPLEQEYGELAPPGPPGFLSRALRSLGIAALGALILLKSCDELIGGTGHGPFALIGLVGGGTLIVWALLYAFIPR